MMEGLPDFAIPPVLSFLRIRDTCRCACVSKQWTPYVQERLIKIKEKAAARMMKEGKGAIDVDLVAAAKEGRLEDLEVLIAIGANAGASIPRGRTALMLAASGGHFLIVEVLLTNGANVNGVSRFGNTALLHASRGGYLSIVKVLITNGANVDARNISGRTPLMYAATDCKADVVEALIRAGASPNIRNSDGETALDCAHEKPPHGEHPHYPRTIEILLAAGAKRGIDL